MNFKFTDLYIRNILWIMQITSYIHFKIHLIRDKEIFLRLMMRNIKNFCKLISIKLVLLKLIIDKKIILTVLNLNYPIILMVFIKYYNFLFLI